MPRRSDQASRARRGAPPRSARCRRRATPLDLPRRRARTDAGGAVGSEALDTGTVTNGASNPGDRPRGEPLGAGPEGERPPGVV
jgi:hypothetical protein